MHVTPIMIPHHQFANRHFVAAHNAVGILSSEHHKAEDVYDFTNF
jgi:hypothetical protein